MKKYTLIILISLLSFSSFTQAPITDVVEDWALKSAVMNANFDTLYQKTVGFVTPQMFGDVTGDAYAEFDAAIQYCIDNNLELRIPSGTYILSQILNHTWNGNVQIKGYGNAKLTWPNVFPTGNNFRYWSIINNTFTIDSLMHDLSAYDSVIYVQNADTLSEGDNVLLASSQLWSTSRPTYVRGEIQQVKRIPNDTTIILYEYLFDSYDADSCVVDKVSGRGTNYIENIQIELPDTIQVDKSKVCLYIEEINDLTLNNIRLSGGDYANLRTIRCRDLTLTSVRTSNSRKDELGYGWDSQSCQNVLATGGSFKGARHGVTISGGYPSRNVAVIGNYISNSYPYSGAVDTHGPAEFVLFKDNFVDGGFNIRSINTTIEGNFIRQRQVAGYVSIGFTPEYRPRSGFLKITGNNLEPAYRGIRFVFNESNDTLDECIITNNIIKETEAEGILISGSSTTSRINSFIVKNNNVTSQEECFRWEAVDGVKATFLFNDFNTLRSDRDAILISAGGSFDVKDILLFDNNYLKSAGRAFNSVTAASSGLVAFKNNIFDQQTVSLNVVDAPQFLSNNLSLNDNTPFFRTSTAFPQDTFYIPDGGIGSDIFCSQQVQPSGTDGDTLVLRCYFYNPVYDIAGFSMKSVLHQYTTGIPDYQAVNRVDVTMDARVPASNVSNVVNVYNVNFTYPNFNDQSYAGDYADIYIVNTDVTRIGRFKGTITNAYNIYKIETFTK